MENEPLLILFLASWYKTNESDTSGSFIEEETRMLMDRGHKVTVVHPVEAIASGKSVVAMDSGGERDIINAENAIITKLNSIIFNEGLALANIKSSQLQS